MQAFHNDPAIKRKYIARVKQHRLADELKQGAGWEQNGTTRGCAVGCTLDTYDHSRYPIELGIPEWLAHLEDKIFEELPREKALKWPEKFLSAINPGADLEPLKHIIAIERLQCIVKVQEAAIGDKYGVVAALRLAIAYHKNPSESAQSAAYSASRSAALSAQSAAYSASRSAAMTAGLSAAESAAAAARSAARSLAEESAWSALAEESAWSALAAGQAAYSASRSAALSAQSAAWYAAWEKEAAYLIKVLKECK